MRMPMTADDVILAILYFMKKHDIKKFTADRERLHRAFFNISKNSPRVMSIFSFREREMFPESSQLDQALSNLDATGIISRQNLTPRYYFFENSLDKSYKKFSKKIIFESGIKESEIEKVAVDIAKLV